MLKRETAFKLVIGILITSLIVGIWMLFYLSPFSQDLAYHNFADQRSFLGIPFFSDVVSNILFFLAGLQGLSWVNKSKIFTQKMEKFPWLVAGISACLISIGSTYYHLNPNNHTLVWDRLPMTLFFMSVLSIIIMERASIRLGIILFPFLLFLGAWSVFYWSYTENLGRGDLRPYLLVQYLPMILTFIACFTFKSIYSGNRYWTLALASYLLAKVSESYDKEIFIFLNALSGHTLKHILAALSMYAIFLSVKKRKIKNLIF